MNSLSDAFTLIVRGFLFFWGGGGGGREGVRSKLPEWTRFQIGFRYDYMHNAEWRVLYNSVLTDNKKFLKGYTIIMSYE